MKIPRRVKIGKRIWKVCFRDLSKTGNIGITFYNKLEIHINKHSSIEEQEIIFAHEVLHALLMDVGLPYEVEEPIVEAAEKNMLGLLKWAGL
jgi:hypothetical protein